MVYRKLKTWYNGSLDIIPKFKEVFPEIKGLSTEEMRERLQRLDMKFYYEEVKPVSLWTRLTLPFALLTMLLMILSLPIVFLITGKWTYPLGQKNTILNWFKSLKL